VDGNTADKQEESLKRKATAAGASAGQTNGNAAKRRR
jgi:hypothetical protein